MKKFLLFCIAFISLGFQAFSATRTTIASGDFTDPNIWDCTCVPGSGDVVRLEDGDTLTISTSVTVSEFRYRFGENSSDASRLIVTGTLNIAAGDFRFEAPFFSNSTADVFISSTGTINVGDEFRLLLSNNENFLTYNITVDGSLNITTSFSQASGFLSNNTVVNLVVNGSFTCGTIGSLFSTDNSEFNLTVSGNFDSGNFSVVGNGDNNVFHAIFNNGADADVGNTTVIMDGQNSIIRIEVLAGGDFRMGNQALTLSSNSTNSKIEVSSAGIYRGAPIDFATQGSNDTLFISVTGAGEMRSNTQLRGNSTGTANYQNIEVAAGASLISVTNLRFDLAADGIFNFLNEGNTITSFPNLRDFLLTMGNGATGTFENSGFMNFRDFRFTFGDDNLFTIDQNGEMIANRNFDLSAKSDNVIEVNMNGSANFIGRYLSSTNGDNSAITTVISDSLVCGQLRMDVLTTAATADNVIDMTAAGAVLSVTSLNMDNGVRDATILTATDGSTTTEFRGSTTTDLPIRATVDYDNLIISNTSAGGVTLDEGNLDISNFHGDLTVATNATFDLNGTNTVAVQGNLNNAGTFEDNGQGLSVVGDFTNSFVFNNAGSDFTVGGNFLNSGTFNTTASTSIMDITGNFTNSGTFDAEIATLDVGGNFSNTANYSSAGNDINLDGNWSNTGTYTFSDGDVVRMRGTSAQQITGTTTFYDLNLDNASGVSIPSGTTSIQRLLDVDAGTFTTNGNLILLSNASGTGMVGNLTGGGSISGNVTVQRFLNKGNGWYMLGSPVNGSTLADWNTELPMSGFTGSDEPNNSWVSVYTFDDATRPNGAPFNQSPNDSGYVEATNTTNPVTNGTGFFVYFQQVKAGKTARTADLTGTLNNGAKSISLKYSCFDVDLEANGWNLISNPYASPVQWSLVTRNNLQNSNACYRLDSLGNYDAITTGNIYSGEAVWVQAAGSYLPPFSYGLGSTTNYVNSITFNQNDKVVASDIFNQRSGLDSTEENFPLSLKLTYARNSDYYDISKLKINSNASVYYDMDYDARKLSNALYYYPNIASTTADDSTGERLLWNTLPGDDSTIIPITIWQKAPLNRMESYTITFDGIENWDKNNRCLIMEDKLNNNTKKLSANDMDYTFSSMDTLTNPYIYLTYFTPLEYSSDNATCFGYNDGFASVKGLGSGAHDYIWVDHMNNIVMNEKDKIGPSTMNNLAPGEYVIYVSDNGVCGEVAATIKITEPEPIIADFDSDVDSVWMNANSTIYFSNASINADDYHWDFGDGNTSDQESPAHTYIAGGTYTVKLVGITGPCSDTLTKTVVVFDNVGIDEQLSRFKDPINIYQYNNETYVDLNFSEATDVVISMFDVLGRNIIEPMNLINVKERKELLDVPGNLMGVYTISVIAGDEKESKKIYYTRK